MVTPLAASGHWYTLSETLAAMCVLHEARAAFFRVLAFPGGRVSDATAMALAVGIAAREAYTHASPITLATSSRSHPEEEGVHQAPAHGKLQAARAAATAAARSTFVRVFAEQAVVGRARRAAKRAGTLAVPDDDTEAGGGDVDDANDD